MAVGRMLNRTAGLDQELNSVSVEAQLLFVMSIPHLDRDGLIIGEALPHLGTVLPLRPEFFPKYEDLLSELVGCQIVVRYATKKGRVLFFPGFRKNQTFSYQREGASIFAPPPGYIRTPSGIEPDKSESESEVTQELLMTESEVTPDHYPLKISKIKISKGDSQPPPDDTGLAQRMEMARQYEAVMGQTVSSAAYLDMTDYMKKLQARDAVSWWSLAITETTGAKRPGWQYMKAVLESWLAAGQPSTNGKATTPKASKPQRFVVAVGNENVWYRSENGVDIEERREVRPV